MADSSLAKKLNIKSGQRILIINAPSGYLDEIGPLPEGVALRTEPEGTFDLVHLFARNSQELGDLAPSALQAVKSDGWLWISYPKASSKIETDLTRDVGWSVLYQAGMRAVALVSINDVWSALRFRPSETASAGEMIEAQYAGPKASLRPIYDRVVSVVQGFGSDVEIAPRKSYVAFIRGKQFAVIRASTNTRVDIGLKLRGKAAAGRLEAAGNFGSGSITHKVALTRPDDVDEELMGWLHEAYDEVG